MKQVIDNERKAKVLNNGLYASYLKARKELYLKGNDNAVNDLTEYLLEESCETDEEWDNMYFDLLTCERLANSNYKKIKRLKDRINSFIEKSILLDEKLIFFTLTFNDKTLSVTKEETRRKYVVRYLNTECVEFVANVDYGKENGREHYHAVGILKDNKKNANRKNWEKYGNCDFKRVATQTKDVKRLAKYLVKLTNHALKETTKNKKVIYSR